MAIFLDDSSKVIVQGMTGSEGMKHTQRMLRSGTDVVGAATMPPVVESVNARNTNNERRTSSSYWPDNSGCAAHFDQYSCVVSIASE